MQCSFDALSKLSALEKTIALIVMHELPILQQLTDGQTLVKCMQYIIMYF